MSVIDKLNNIINCKNAIRAAINNKGGVLTESSKLRDYATAIDNLTAGGGSENRSGLIEVKSLPDNKYDTTSIYTTPYKFNDILINVQVKEAGNEAILFSKLSVELGAPLTGGEVVDSLPTENIVETTQTSGFYVYYSISNNEAYMYSTELGGWKPLSEFFCTMFDGILMPCQGFINSKLNGVVLGHGYYIVNADDYYKYFNIWEEITYSGDGSDIIDSGFDLPEKNIDKDKVYKVKYFDDIYAVPEEGKAGEYLAGHLFYLCGIDVCDELPTNNIISPPEGGVTHFQHVYYVKNKDVYVYASTEKRFGTISEALHNLTGTTIPFKGEVDEDNNSNNTTLGIYAAYRYRYYRSTSQAEKLKHNSQELNVPPSTESQEFEATGNNYYNRVTVEPVTSTIDTNIVPENIAKNVTILGVTGTLQGGIPGTNYYLPDSSEKYNLDIVADEANLNRIDITSSSTGDTAVNIFATEKITNVSLNGGSNGNLTGIVNIATTNYTGTIVADNLVPENIAKGKTILGVQGTLESGGGANITANIKITGNKDDILGTTEHNKLCILSDTNNLSFKVVNKIEGESEKISTLSTVLPQKLRDCACAAYGDNVYIFGGRAANNAVDTIYKFNCTTETITTLSTKLPQVLYEACCATFGDNIYIFGGYATIASNAIYKFNCLNEKISILATKLPQQVHRACCALYNDIIYIFGGSSSSTSYLSTVYKFNCTNETISSLGNYLPQGIRDACCAIHDNDIYIFGGYGSAAALNTIYRFHCTNEGLSNIGTLPDKLYDACCSKYNNDIYIFGGANVRAELNTIYKFNCVDKTISTLIGRIPYALVDSCCVSHNNDIYIFGGYTGVSFANTIYKFPILLELTANNVLIYNANSNYSFDLITDQVTIPVKNVYIGDNNNIRQLASAYLYDQSKSAWVNVNTGEKLTA